MTVVLTTLASFGSQPFNFNGLVADSKGDLFGTTVDGTVFELVNNNGTYNLIANLTVPARRLTSRPSLPPVA